VKKIVPKIIRACGPCLPKKSGSISIANMHLCIALDRLSVAARPLLVRRAISGYMYVGMRTCYLSAMSLDVDMVRVKILNALRYLTAPVHAQTLNAT